MWERFSSFVVDDGFVEWWWCHRRRRKRVYKCLRILCIILLGDSTTTIPTTTIPTTIPTARRIRNRP